jgi:hypothetical protein
MTIFIEEPDLELLTGIPREKNQRLEDLYKARCDQLRKQRIPFHVNARGAPCVPRAVVEFQSVVLPASQEWQSEHQ